MAVRRRRAAPRGPELARHSRALARYFGRIFGIADADQLSDEELRAAVEELRATGHPLRVEMAEEIAGALDAADQGRAYRPYSERRR